MKVLMSSIIIGLFAGVCAGLAHHFGYKLGYRTGFKDGKDDKALDFHGGQDEVCGIARVIRVEGRTGQVAFDHLNVQADFPANRLEGVAENVIQLHNFAVKILLSIIGAR